MKTPYDLRLNPVPGATATITQEDGTRVSFVVRNGEWVVGQTAVVPGGSAPGGSVGGSGNQSTAAPTGAVWVDTITGKETPVNPLHMSTRADAEAMLARLQALAPGFQGVIQEIRPENPFSRIDYRGDERRHWYIDGYNVGLLLDRYRRYSQEAADQMTLAELGRGKIQTTVPLGQASPPPPKTDPPREPQPLVQPQPQRPAEEPGVMEGDVMRIGLMSMRQRVVELASESGSSLWNWDQWNWFYQAAGGTPISPEAVGLTRDARGQVIIDGQAAYPLETWERLSGANLGGQASAPSVPPPLAQPPGEPTRMNMQLIFFAGLSLLVLFRLLRS